MAFAPQIFAPNSHSDFEIRWSAVSAEQEELIKNLLKEKFGIADIFEIMQVGAMEVRSNNFRVSYKNKGELVRVVLRKHIQHKTPEALVAIDAILHLVKESGVRAPEVISALDGKNFVEEGVMLWQLFKFIPGNYYRGTEEELRAAAVGIAHLHRALANLPQKKETSSPSWTLPTLEDFEPLFKHAKEEKSPLSLLVVEQEEPFTERIKMLAIRAEAIKESGMQMIHADLHPHNFLFDDGHLTAILDFGDVRLGFRAADAASAAHRLVRQYTVYLVKPWQEVLENGLSIFIGEYQKAFPLSPKELMLFSDFMTLALLRKVKGNLLKFYEKKQDWTHDVAHKEFLKQLNLLAEIDCMKESLERVIQEIV